MIATTAMESSSIMWPSSRVSGESAVEPRPKVSATSARTSARMLASTGAVSRGPAPALPVDPLTRLPESYESTWTTHQESEHCPTFLFTMRSYPTPPGPGQESHVAIRPNRDAVHVSHGQSKLREEPLLSRQSSTHRFELTQSAAHAQLLLLQFKGTDVIAISLWT